MTVPTQRNAGSQVTTGRTWTVNLSRGHHDDFCIRFRTSSERPFFALPLAKVKYYWLKYGSEGEATVKSVLYHRHLIAHLHDRLIESNQCIPEHPIMCTSIFSRYPLHFAMISQVRLAMGEDLLTLYINQLCPSLDLSF